MRGVENETRWIEHCIFNRTGSKCIRAGFTKYESYVDVTADCILAILHYVEDQNKENNTEHKGDTIIDWNEEYDLKISYEWIKK